MATGGDWISLNRSIKGHWIWDDPLKFRCWVDILMTVNHKFAKINIGMQLMDCKRGQSVMSLTNWAQRWGVSKDWARNFLNLLEKDGMILHENMIKTTRITVCNYDVYQNNLHDEPTLSNRNENAEPTQSHTNNKVNKENNVNKVESKRFTPPSVLDVSLYVSEKGFHFDPQQFVDHYISVGWIVGKTKMKDWQATARNWESREKPKTTYKHPAQALLSDCEIKEQAKRF